MDVALLSTDLMVISRVDVDARGAGLVLKSTSAIDRAAIAGDVRTLRLVLVDLGMPGLDVRELVETVKSASADAPTIIAFGPHVHETLLADARAAGCDEVWSRGQFFAQVGGLLNRVAGNYGAAGGA